MPQPGRRLRTLRSRLGLSLREVQAASVRIAEKHNRNEYFLSPSRLSDFETKDKLPNIFQLASLAEIYSCGLRKLLSWYGIRL